MFYVWWLGIRRSSGGKSVRTLESGREWRKNQRNFKIHRIGNGRHHELKVFEP